jgi:hypothetical protein
MDGKAMVNASFRRAGFSGRKERQKRTASSKTIRENRNVGFGGSGGSGSVQIRGLLLLAQLKIFAAWRAPHPESYKDWYTRALSPIAHSLSFVFSRQLVIESEALGSA